VSAARIRDVIDVNRRWSVWRGDLQFATRVGTVKGHDRRAAREAARVSFTGRFFVEEESDQ
jgi:hypothetical protein